MACWVSAGSFHWVEGNPLTQYAQAPAACGPSAAGSGGGNPVPVAAAVTGQGFAGAGWEPSSARRRTDGANELGVPAVGQVVDEGEDDGDGLGEEQGSPAEG